MMGKRPNCGMLHWGAGAAVGGDTGSYQVQSALSSTNQIVGDTPETVEYLG